MFKKLSDAIKYIPDIYERTDKAFWDDEYISKSMLQAHLEPDIDSASRKHDFIKKSADWMSSLELSGKRLLDLGCGVGLYAENFAKKGFKVTGIDISNRSIEYASQSAMQADLAIEYICQNYIDIKYKDEFDIAILIYCDLGVLSKVEREDLLRKIYLSLKPGGALITDVWSMVQYTEFADTVDISYEDSGFWCEEQNVCVQRNKCYEDNHFLEQYIVITENDCATYNIWNHAFTTSEIGNELEEAGFSNIEIYGDVSGEIFDGRSNTICTIGRRK